jgi:U3 small nucleolar RNA-associated protein 21
MNTWVTLPLLDAIKERNRALLPPKKRDVAFFLPTTKELRPTFIIETEEKRNAPDAAVRPVSHSTSRIKRYILASEYDMAMTELKGLTAGGIGAELRMLVDFNDGVTDYTEEEVSLARNAAIQTLRFFEHHLRRERDADLVQGMLADTLRAHGVALLRLSRVCDTLRDAMNAVAELQCGLVRTLTHIVEYPQNLLANFTGSVF